MLIAIVLAVSFTVLMNFIGKSVSKNQIKCTQTPKNEPEKCQRNGTTLKHTQTQTYGICVCLFHVFSTKGGKILFASEIKGIFTAFGGTIFRSTARRAFIFWNHSIVLYCSAMSFVPMAKI